MGKALADPRGRALGAVIWEILKKNLCRRPLLSKSWIRPWKVMFSQAPVCSQAGWCVQGGCPDWVSRGLVVMCLGGGRSPRWGWGVWGLLSYPRPPTYGQPAVGTHPTGMHSCYQLC